MSSRSQSMFSWNQCFTPYTLLLHISNFSGSRSYQQFYFKRLPTVTNGFYIKITHPPVSNAVCKDDAPGLRITTAIAPIINILAERWQQSPLMSMSRPRPMRMAATAPIAGMGRRPLGRIWPVKRSPPPLHWKRFGTVISLCICTMHILSSAKMVLVVRRHPSGYILFYFPL